MRETLSTFRGSSGVVVGIYTYRKNATHDVVLGPSQRAVPVQRICASLVPATPGAPFGDTAGALCAGW